MLKSSYNYWKKREAEQYQNNIRDLERYNAYIEEIYQRMQDEINKEIEAFYAKYADKEGITMAAAKKMADKLDIEEYARKAKRYVQDKDFSDQANREMRLYNMTMKVNRLELLRAKLGLEMVAANDEMNKFFGETLTDKAMTEFQRQSGILGMTILDNEKKAHSIVNASFHNANWSERIWASQDELRGVLDQELQRGLIRGLNPRTLTGDIKKYIKNDIDKVKYAAERLMRTELARVQTDAQLKSYEDAGYTEYMFIANGKTACKHCMEIDGEHFRIEDMEIAENAPPMHPNCMCSTAPWMERSTITGQTNYAKAIDSFDISEQAKTNYNVEDILEDMSRSPVGKDVIRHIRDTDVRIKIENQDPNGEGIRGVQQGNQIIIYSGNTDSTLIAAQTVIHEMTHYYYNIGCCQHAEAICFAMEKMHKERKNTLTTEEWDYVVKLAKDNYPEYNWDEGGYGSYDQFDFVEKIAKR